MIGLEFIAALLVVHLDYRGRKFFFEFMCLYNINYIKLLVDIECILLGAN
jgi:hypothetical protein